MKETNQLVRFVVAEAAATTILDKGKFRIDPFANWEAAWIMTGRRATGPDIAVTTKYPPPRFSWVKAGKYRAVLYHIYINTYYTIYTGFSRVYSYPDCYWVASCPMSGGSDLRSKGV